MKNFRIGMPALIELASFDDTVDLCRELSLDFIELNMNLPSNFIENLDSSHLMSVKEKHKLSYTMHMPDDADMGVFFEPVRKGYVQLSIDTIEWAYHSGVELLNFHIIEGAKMTLPDRKVYIYDQYEDVFIAKFTESFLKTAEAGFKKGVKINIENSGNFGNSFAQKALNSVLRFKGTGLTWDVGHDSAKNYVDHDFLMKKIDFISHMHCHDTLGSKDHLVPFTGELDIENRLAFAKERGLTVVIEVKTIAALKESIYVLRQKKLI
ncbi:MAG: sugar phosphate isomerase/epimerase [Tissierellales bacterium]|nr:sugar phosphate isomerase/epimerase [Tissierellales bacterium]